MPRRDFFDAPQGPRAPEPIPGGLPPAVPRFFVLAILALLLAGAWGIFQWFFCRVEVEAGSVLVLIKKTGTDLPAGEIIAPDPSYKGIQPGTKPAGRYFYNPLFWAWEKTPAKDVGSDQVGIRIRRFGRDPDLASLQAGRVTARDGDPARGVAPEKGIVPGVLKPGRHDVNPYEYDVEIRPAIRIDPGFVGIRTNVDGAAARTPNTFLVGEGEKGVVRDPLPPGKYYVNPYEVGIEVMNVQSQRFEVSEADAITFPSSDGFPIAALMTIEWAVEAARAPEVYVRIGVLEEDPARPDPARNEILQKLLLPAVRGFARIEGSKYSAANYISGESRLVFQNGLLTKLKDYCEGRGVLVKAVLINKIVPPIEIAGPIQEREIAKEELNRNRNQLEEAKARQSLMRQTALVEQERAKVEVETVKKQALIGAKNRQEVALIGQERNLAVAQTVLEAARKEAEAIRARGSAEADVIQLKASAEAEALKRSVAAFRDGGSYAAYEFARQIAPRIESVFADTASPLGRLFEGFLPGARRGEEPGVGAPGGAKP